MQENNSQKHNLSTEQIVHFRSQSHHLHPVVMLGHKGLTEEVLKEIEICLNAHQLIKVKIKQDKEIRQQMALEICTRTGAHLIDEIGHVAVIYRPQVSDDKNTSTPNLLKSSPKTKHQGKKTNCRTKPKKQTKVYRRR